MICKDVYPTLQNCYLNASEILSRALIVKITAYLKLPIIKIEKRKLFTSIETNFHSILRLMKNQMIVWRKFVSSLVFREH